MVFVLGIDEAGRGPVLGPMVMAGAVFDESREDELRQRGIKDSKLLTPRKREALFEWIKENAYKYKIIIIPPSKIDDVILRDQTLNLNWLEAEFSALMINELKPNKVIMDCPTPTCSKYNDYVKDRVDDKSIEVISEHKADLNHMTAAAASILAKETREQEIQKLKKEIGIDFGSGYQTDPKTMKFLNENWEKHSKLFRHSWKTYQKVKMAKDQSKLDNF